MMRLVALWDRSVRLALNDVGGHRGALVGAAPTRADDRLDVRVDGSPTASSLRGPEPRGCRGPCQCLAPSGCGRKSDDQKSGDQRAFDRLPGPSAVSLCSSPSGRPDLALASTLPGGVPTFLDRPPERSRRGHPADSPSPDQSTSRAATLVRRPWSGVAGLAVVDVGVVRRRLQGGDVARAGVVVRSERELNRSQ